MATLPPHESLYNASPPRFAWLDESVVLHLQFETLQHADRMDCHVDEHIDEAYGGFREGECDQIVRCMYIVVLEGDYMTFHLC